MHHFARGRVQPNEHECATVLVGCSHRELTGRSRIGDTLAAMTSPFVRTAALVALLIATAACGSDVASDEPLGDQLDGGERSEFIDGFVEGTNGTVARSEAECVSNAMFDADLTLEEIMSASSSSTGPGAPVLAEALDRCIDPTLDMDVPLEGEVRELIGDGLQGSGLTAEQVDCFLDAYVAAGIDARDLFLAGLSPNPDVDAVGAEAFGACG